jgi:S1-C subfamily serine protease
MRWRWLRPLRRIAVPLTVVLVGAALGALGMALLRPAGLPGASTSSLTGSTGGRDDGLNDQAVYDKLAPSVVDITATLRYDGETAEGTGFAFGSSGDLVLTNNHVIRDSTSVEVTVALTGKAYAANVVGTDVGADIAVLQLDGRPRLRGATIGDSADVRLGDPVLAIGNQAGQGGAPTIAPGIINSLHRTVKANDADSGFTETLHDMIQTSAQIEPGDSGGPLANAAGQIIGIDTAASTGAGSAGFAIQASSAVSIARQIASGQPTAGITIGTGGFLGVLVASGTSARAPSESPVSLTLLPFAGTARGPGCLTTQSEAEMPATGTTGRSGAWVEGVLCATPAAASGLAEGDVIIRAAGRPVSSPKELVSIVAGCEPDTEVPVTWAEANGVLKTALIRVGSAPAP